MNQYILPRLDWRIALKKVYGQARRNIRIICLQVIEKLGTKVSDQAKESQRIMESYGNQILRLAYSYFGNMSDAEDILQETLIKFLLKAPSFESAEHEKAWLLKVAMNMCRTRKKREKKVIAMTINDDLLSSIDEDLSFVWEAVFQLPEKYREVIHLFYQEGYSSKEIGHLLDKSDTTVRSLLHRGRAKLKEILREEYDFE